MIRQILVALVWFCIALLGLAVFIVMIPFIIIAFIIAFIMGLFGKSTFRIWTMRARQTAHDVSSKAQRTTIGGNSHKNSSKQPAGKVVDADVKDVE